MKIPVAMERLRSVTHRRTVPGPGRRRVLVTICGFPGTVEDQRPTLLGKSHRFVGETFSDSRMDGASKGVEPRVPGIAGRAVPSNNSR
jgi:hypothetical protein